jgi:DNA-binding SARP family transcriptional activator
MPGYAFTLFGKFGAKFGNVPLRDIERGKTQELMGYLLLHRNEMHHREQLAALFWAEFTTAQSKKYLRQALWQLQKALDEPNGADPRLLAIQPDWVNVNGQAALWIDVDAFEQALGLATNIPGGALAKEQARALKHAASLYTGQLLAGWYFDWCIFERERLEGMYLQLLDKLMDYCESTQEYEEGISYGMRVLRHDRAREMTHRRLIRLFYLAGDRTAALQQYKRCVVALKDDLGVAPSRRTEELWEQVRADRWDAVVSSSRTSLQHTLTRLNHLQTALDHIQSRVQQEIGSLQHLIQGQTPSFSAPVTNAASSLDRPV